MELTRKAFIAALLGIPVVGRAVELLHRNLPREPLIISCAKDLPVKLGVGDRLSVSFTAAPSRHEPFVSFLVKRDEDFPEGGTNWMFPLLRVPEQHLFIAEREYWLTDIRVAAANMAPVHWKVKRHEPANYQV